MLNTRYISSWDTLPMDCNSENMGGTYHEVVSNRAASPSGNTLGTFSTSPPPVMWAIPFTSEKTGRTA